MCSILSECVIDIDICYFWFTISLIYFTNICICCWCLLRVKLLSDSKFYSTYFTVFCIPFTNPFFMRNLIWSAHSSNCDKRQVNVDSIFCDDYCVYCLIPAATVHRDIQHWIRLSQKNQTAVVVDSSSRGIQTCRIVFPICTELNLQQLLHCRWF